MDFYMVAYTDLRTCRNEQGEVPWLAINAYAYRYEIRGDEFDWLVRVINYLDQYFAARRPEGEGRDAAGSGAPDHTAGKAS